MTGRRVRLGLAYDGAGFAGWQVQPGAPTVQGLLQDVLTRLSSGRPVAVRGSGRTDAGVHARGQVADALVATRLDDARLLRALRRILPPAVSVWDLATVPDGFHARACAAGKTYRYLLDLSPHGDPALAGHALRVRGPLDPGAVREGLSRLPGRRDWSGFAGAACEVEDRVRTLTEARWVEEPGRRLAALVFSADGFLTHMVRNLAGTLLAIGAGRFGPDRIDEVLATGDRARAGATAPPHALRLERVSYPPPWAVPGPPPAGPAAALV